MNPTRKRRVTFFKICVTPEKPKDSYYPETKKTSCNAQTHWPNQSLRLDDVMNENNEE